MVSEKQGTNDTRIEHGQQKIRCIDKGKRITEDVYHVAKNTMIYSHSAGTISRGFEPFSSLQKISKIKDIGIFTGHEFVRILP